MKLGYGLFVFDCLENASNYVRTSKYLSVYEAEIDTLIPFVPVLGCRFSVNADFLLQGTVGDTFLMAPAGTLCVHGVKLLTKVL